MWGPRCFFTVDVELLTSAGPRGSNLTEAGHRGEWLDLPGTSLARKAPLETQWQAEGARYPFVLALVTCDGLSSPPPLSCRQNIRLTLDLEGQGLVIKTGMLALIWGHRSCWPFVQEMMLPISPVLILCCWPNCFGSKTLPSRAVSALRPAILPAAILETLRVLMTPRPPGRACSLPTDDGFYMRFSLPPLHPLPATDC